MTIGSVQATAAHAAYPRFTEAGKFAESLRKAVTKQPTATGGASGKASNPRALVRAFTRVRSLFPSSPKKNQAEPSIAGSKLEHANLKRSQSNMTATPSAAAAAGGVVAETGHAKEIGILGSSTRPKTDADIIMTAAVVGHALKLLEEGKNCSFDTEVNSPGKTDEELAGDWHLHRQGVDKINKALRNMGGLYGMPGKGKEAIAGVTPDYRPEHGVARIIGGSGDLPLNSPERYLPAMPADPAGSKLYALASVPGVGYQGRGAYTGFVQGREGGQRNLFSTYRHRIPENQGQRWIPSDTTGLGAPIGPLPKQRTWGMIGNNALQEPLEPQTPKKQKRPDETPKGQTLKEQGMYFRDQDPAQGPQVTLSDNDIVGYTHGMIQAIYDVALRKVIDPGKEPGVPYEIAVGEHTTKLASCFTCAIFMQANGFPASATHLGRGESWSPLYPEGDHIHSTQDRTKIECNEKWEAYCKTIIEKGIQCIEGLVADDHIGSFEELKKNIAGKQPLHYANLVLDAVTVHDSEIKRIDRTLKA